jgi:hypothetical protein
MPLVNHEYTSMTGTLVTMLDQAFCPDRALVLAGFIGAEAVCATTGSRILVRVF